MGKRTEYEIKQVQKVKTAYNIRQHVIEQLNTYQAAIEELSDEEIEKIAGGGPKKQMFNYAGRLLDTATVAFAGWSVHKTGCIFQKK